MIRRLLATTALLAGIWFVVTPMPASAATLPPQLKQAAVCGGSVADALGLEPWYSCILNSKNQPQIDNLNDIWLIALTIMEDAIKAGSYIAVGFIIWGGIKYTKSQGDAGQLSQAKDVIRNAIIGLVITLLAVAIVQFIAQGIK